ncbi:ABC transporter permease [Fimbriimonas ginsengisoli]|uniref:Ribose transport system permease protein rbsC n=1 Tax=Fimbriimonas ginsengisoli Gsoil 348 TaxID=661478 RepID=A0A068NJK8_FIMGI|nr:ABC transporter permease [Fimbriimonas ginsengisoli]AIE83632.1 ribose transport system permease protein rbsC [Fimbriimonas ginsengisoli Gsoil 348]
MLNFIALVVVLSTPLLLAAMGGFTSERAGVINIGLEGMMLMSACVAALVGVKMGAVGGLAAGIGSGIVMAMIHWVATQVYRIDHVISGMAINALAAGGTNFLFERFTDPNRTGSVPVLPMAFYDWLAFLVPVALWLYVRKTRGGLRLLAVGSDPEKSRLMGVQPLRVRFFGLLATGVLTGLAGVALVTDTGVFTDNMTAGRGYIALAALVLGGWRPIPAMLACVGFGFFSALRLQLEGNPHLPNLPTEAWAALPYVVTVIALAGFLGRSRTPAGLGKA